MKRLFDFSIIKTLWAARLQSIFQTIFGKSPVKSLKNENQVKPTLSNAPKANLNISPSPAPSKREMHSSAVVKTAFRKPMIKFIGARLPRPFFDAKSLPPLQVSGNFAAAVSAPKPSASSIGPVGKIPRGQGIEWTQLPAKFRRGGLSEEECEAVNSGFSYHQ